MQHTNSCDRVIYLRAIYKFVQAEQRVQVNLMRFNRFKCKVLHMWHSNPYYESKLGVIRMEHSPAIKDLGVLVDGKPDVSQHFALAAQKAKHILGYIKRSVTIRSRQVIQSLCFVLVRPHLEYCVQVWSPQCRRDTDLLACIQRRVPKMIQGMEHVSY